MVGGLNELHTQEITMIKAGEVSQYGWPWELLSEVYLKHACNLWGAPRKNSKMIIREKGFHAELLFW